MFKFFDSKMLYEDARVEWTKRSGPEWTCPKGFRPIFAYGFMRHALRYNSNKGIDDYKQWISDNTWPADMDSPDHPKSAWSLMKVTSDKGWQLTEVGLRETEEQGFRIAKNWPQLFGDLTKVQFGSSREDRSLYTGKRFLDGANRANETDVPFNPIQPMDVCKYHIDWGWFNEKESDKKDREAMETILWARPDWLQLLERIRKRLPDIQVNNELLHKFWRLAGDSYTWFGDYEPFGSLFTLDEHYLIELSEELDDYYRDIYGVREFIRTKPNPVIVEFLEILEQIIRGATDQPKVALRFSHSCACKRLVACLGIFDDWSWDNVAAMDPQAERVLRMSLWCPNSANYFLMAFVREDVQKVTEKDVLVSVMIQERLVELKRCKPTDHFGMYMLDDFRTVMIDNILKQAEMAN